MPLIKESNFHPPILCKNYHLQTIYPALFRSVNGLNYERERLELPDGDFLDIDWERKGSKQLVVVCHGLEGDSSSQYVRGIMKKFTSNSWDGLALNFRGCSGEINRLLKAYHSGETEDLHYVIQYAIKTGNYNHIVLVGFSLGGNVVLKYLGENSRNLLKEIKAGVAVSVPCDLEGCGLEMERKENWMYLNRFLVSLKKKLKEKSHLIKGQIDMERAMSAKTFMVFDDAATAPIHGFSSGLDYYEKSNSLQFLHQISIPTLLLTAEDDSFLGKSSYPFEIAQKSDHFYFESPKYGGHVGFYQRTPHGYSYAEQRAWEFISKHGPNI